MSTEKLLRERRAALAANRTQSLALEREIEKLTRRLNDEKIQEITDDLATYQGGLNLAPIRDALVGDNTATDLDGTLGNTLCLLGIGPWESDDFSDFLAERDFLLTDHKHSFDVLVLGRSIDEEEMISLRAILDYQIDRAEPLTVVSQELLILALVTLENPLELLSEDELYAVAAGHGGLTTVIEYEGFDWLFQEGGREEDEENEDEIFEFDASALSAESPLHRVGYTVAEGRLSVAERRRCLKEMFEIDGDDVFKAKEEYQVWGNAGTQQRLYAMARHISWLIGFRGETAPNAAERWRNDLEWLKENYYRSGMKFGWPLSNAPRSQSKERKASPPPISSTWPFPTRQR
jgi:hypothetical protein